MSQKINLREFVRGLAASRSDCVGVLARELVRLPPPQWSVVSLRKHVKPHREEWLARLLQEFEGR